jgi:hypothetical protein
VSTVFVRGSIDLVNVTADGTSTVVLSGVTKAVKADLEGISKVYVDAASGNEISDTVAPCACMLSDARPWHARNQLSIQQWQS